MLNSLDTDDVSGIEEAFHEIAQAEVIIYSKLDRRLAYLKILLRKCD
jgi:hypothetical protein